MASQRIDGEASSSNVTPIKDIPPDDEVSDLNDGWLAAIRSTIRDMQIILSSGGTITYLSTSCKGLLGYDPEQLIRQKITDYIHEDDLPTFASELFESQTTGKTFRFHCRVRRAQTASDDGKPSPGVMAAMPDYAIFEIQGHFEAIEPSAESAVNAILQPDGGTGGFFSVMARPYPLSQSAEIDRFLALKLEELVLNSHITQLRAEEGVLEEATALSPSHLSPDGQFMENPPFLVPGINPLINPQSQQGASLSPLDHAPDSTFSGPEHHSTLESPFISPPLNSQQPQPLSPLVSPPSGFPPQPSPYPLLPGMPPPLLRHGSSTDTATPSASFPSTPTPLAGAATPVCHVAPTSRTPTVVSGDLGIMYTLKSVKTSPDAAPIMMPATSLGLGPPPPSAPPAQPGGVSVPGGSYFSPDAATAATATEMPPTTLLDRPGPLPFTAAGPPGLQAQQQPPFPPPFPTAAASTAPPGFQVPPFPPVPMQSGVPIQPGPHQPPYVTPGSSVMGGVPGPGPSSFVPGPGGIPLDLVMLPPHQQQHHLGVGMGPEAAHPGGGNGLPPGAAAAGTKGGAAAVTVSRGPKNATGASAQGKGYVCVECGTTQAPEWRRGPMGPKTLCNACGWRADRRAAVRWSKGPDGPNSRNRAAAAEAAAAAAARKDEQGSGKGSTAVASSTGNVGAAGEGRVGGKTAD
ncbi:hypothetical protein BKA81DRAFT_382077 [Phyllosticta paracitricarpa]